MRRLLMKSAWKALETWKLHAHEQAQMHIVCDRVRGMLTKRCRSRAFDTWHLHAQKQARAWKIVTRIVDHWIHRTTAKAFDT
jgi:hypothetical protein